MGPRPQLRRPPGPDLRPCLSWSPPCGSDQSSKMRRQFLPSQAEGEAVDAAMNEVEPAAHSTELSRGVGEHARGFARWNGGWDCGREQAWAYAGHRGLSAESALQPMAAVAWGTLPGAATATGAPLRLSSGPGFALVLPGARVAFRPLQRSGVTGALCNQRLLLDTQQHVFSFALLLGVSTGNPCTKCP